MMMCKDVSRYSKAELKGEIPINCIDQDNYSACSDSIDNIGHSLPMDVNILYDPQNKQVEMVERIDSCKTSLPSQQEQNKWESILVGRSIVVYNGVLFQSGSAVYNFTGQRVVAAATSDEHIIVLTDRYLYIFGADGGELQCRVACCGVHSMFVLPHTIFQMQSGIVLELLVEQNNCLLVLSFATTEGEMVAKYRNVFFSDPAAVILTKAELEEGEYLVIEYVDIAFKQQFSVFRLHASGKSAIILELIATTGSHKYARNQWLSAKTSVIYSTQRLSIYNDVISGSKKAIGAHGGFFSGKFSENITFRHMDLLVHSGPKAGELCIYNRQNGEVYVTHGRTLIRSDLYQLDHHTCGVELRGDRLVYVYGGDGEYIHLCNDRCNAKVLEHRSWELHSMRKPRAQEINDGAPILRANYVLDDIGMHFHLYFLLDSQKLEKNTEETHICIETTDFIYDAVIERVDLTTQLEECLVKGNQSGYLTNFVRLEGNFMEEDQDHYEQELVLVQVMQKEMLFIIQSMFYPDSSLFLNPQALRQLMTLADYFSYDSNTKASLLYLIIAVITEIRDIGIYAQHFFQIARLTDETMQLLGDIIDWGIADNRLLKQTKVIFSLLDQFLVELSLIRASEKGDVDGFMSIKDYLAQHSNVNSEIQRLLLALLRRFGDEPIIPDLDIDFIETTRFQRVSDEPWKPGVIYSVSLQSIDDLEEISVIAGISLFDGAFNLQNLVEMIEYIRDDHSTGYFCAEAVLEAMQQGKLPKTPVETYYKLWCLETSISDEEKIQQHAKAVVWCIINNLSQYIYNKGDITPEFISLFVQLVGQLTIDDIFLQGEHFQQLSDYSIYYNKCGEEGLSDAQVNMLRDLFGACDTSNTITLRQFATECTAVEKLILLDCVNIQSIEKVSPSLRAQLFKSLPDLSKYTSIILSSQYTDATIELLIYLVESCQNYEHKEEVSKQIFYNIKTHYSSHDKRLYDILNQSIEQQGLQRTFFIIDVFLQFEIPISPNMQIHQTYKQSAEQLGALFSTNSMIEKYKEFRGHYYSMVVGSGDNEESERDRLFMEELQYSVMSSVITKDEFQEQCVNYFLGEDLAGFAAVFMEGLLCGSIPRDTLIQIQKEIVSVGLYGSDRALRRFAALVRFKQNCDLEGMDERVVQLAFQHLPQDTRTAIVSLAGEYSLTALYNAIQQSPPIHEVEEEIFYQLYNKQVFNSDMSVGAFLAAAERLVALYKPDADLASGVGWTINHIVSKLLDKQKIGPSDVMQLEEDGVLTYKRVFSVDLICLVENQHEQLELVDMVVKNVEKILSMAKDTTTVANVCELVLVILDRCADPPLQAEQQNPPRRLLYVPRYSLAYIEQLFSGEQNSPFEELETLDAGRGRDFWPIPHEFEIQYVFETAIEEAQDDPPGKDAFYKLLRYYFVRHNITDLYATDINEIGSHNGDIVRFVFDEKNSELVNALDPTYLNDLLDACREGNLDISCYMENLHPNVSLLLRTHVEFDGSKISMSALQASGIADSPGLASKFGLAEELLLLKKPAITALAYLETVYAACGYKSQGVMSWLRGERPLDLGQLAEAQRGCLHTLQINLIEYLWNLQTLLPESGAEYGVQSQVMADAIAEVIVSDCEEPSGAQGLPTQAAEYIRSIQLPPAKGGAMERDSSSQERIKARGKWDDDDQSQEDEGGTQRGRRGATVWDSPGDELSADGPADGAGRTRTKWDEGESSGSDGRPPAAHCDGQFGTILRTGLTDALQGCVLYCAHVYGVALPRRQVLGSRLSIQCKVFILGQDSVLDALHSEMDAWAGIGPQGATLAYDFCGVWSQVLNEQPLALVRFDPSMATAEELRGYLVNKCLLSGDNPNVAAYLELFEERMSQISVDSITSGPCRAQLRKLYQCVEGSYRNKDFVAFVDGRIGLDYTVRSLLANGEIEIPQDVRRHMVEGYILAAECEPRVKQRAGAGYFESIQLDSLLPSEINVQMYACVHELVSSDGLESVIELLDGLQNIAIKNVLCTYAVLPVGGSDTGKQYLREWLEQLLDQSEGQFFITEDNAWLVVSCPVAGNHPHKVYLPVEILKHAPCIQLITVSDAIGRDEYSVEMSLDHNGQLAVCIKWERELVSGQLNGMLETERTQGKSIANKLMKSATSMLFKGGRK